MMPQQEHMRSHSKSESGQTLVFVTLLAGVLTAVVLASAGHFGASTANTFSFINQQQAQYVNQGIMNIATQQLSQYIEVTPIANLDQGTMTNYLNTNLTPLMAKIPGYSLLKANVEILGINPQAVISTGSYAGMQAPQTTVDVNLRISGLNSVISNLNSVMTLGDIYPFQFLYFFDLPATIKVIPGSNTSFIGRVHYNGDVCIGPSAGSTLTFGSLHSAGGIYEAGTPQCPFGGSPAQGTNLLATNAAYTKFSVLDSSNAHGCTNCGDTATGGQTTVSWTNYDLSQWGNNVLDSSNGIQALNLVTGQPIGTATQYGYSQTLSSISPAYPPYYSNDKTLRFLVDPPQSGDSTAVVSQKYSNTADIRIVDGTWYLRDINNAGNWPGIPIWSDHPGEADDAYGNQIGQDDIRAYWSGKAMPWGANPPTRFSYYQYDATNKTLFGSSASSATVSYGGLAPQSGALGPAGWVNTANLNSPVCAPTGPISCTGVPSGNELVPIKGSCNCGGPSSPVLWSTLALNGTRGGFLDNQISATDLLGAAYAPILPVNLDMNAFQQALTSKSAGELGSYFGSGSFMQKPFNGVLYVTVTWPGSNSGYSSSGVSSWVSGTPPQFFYPTQGSNSDSSQPTVFSNPTTTQQALPYSLCSNSSSGIHPGLAGQKFDSATGAGFSIPDCSQYGSGTTQIRAYPNAVRIFNGGNLSAGTLPTGLSVVTNLPIYTVGDYNTSSVPNPTASPAPPWIPALLAGDVMTILSNAWTDSNDPWDTTPSSTSRIATPTTINAAIMSGITGSFGPPLPAGLLENWKVTTPLTLNGAIVVGYNPVYHMSGVSTAATVYIPPARIINYDPHFNIPIDEPPGTPVFPVITNSKWSDQ
jgi:Flp pilus assembly pilin Flp